MIVFRPPHSVRDRKHLRRIYQRMVKDGWQGRPILVEKVPHEPKTYQAWTGSHRITAAEMAHLKEIPFYVMNDKLLEKLIRRGPDETMWSSPDLEKSDDRCRWALLHDAGETRAANLLQEEIMMNVREQETGRIDP